MSNNRKKTKVTIIDVAREAGTSYGTVSRVLNNNPNVRKSTRERVLEAIKRLGYVPNQQARALVGGQTRVIGVLVPRLDNGYVASIIKGIDEEIDKANYGLMLYTTRHAQHTEETYVHNIAHGMADGLIVILPMAAEAYVDALSQQHFPYVLVDYESNDDSIPTIISTNWQGAYDATKYLIEQGHHRIAFITGRMNVRSAIDRFNGYKAALQDHDIPYLEELIAEGDFMTASGEAATQRLLDLDKSPTAIFACNDLMAFGAMNAIIDHGLRIPTDISLVGFDDIPEASLVRPRLTTVQQPLEQMGRMATRMLLELLNGEELKTRRLTLATHLIPRESCQAL